MTPQTPSSGGHNGTAALLGAFVGALFFSTALANVLALLVLSLALRQWFLERPFALLRHPISVACMAFLAWVLLREAIVARSVLDWVKTLNDVRPIAFAILWAPLFVHEKHRRAVVGVFAFGLLLYTATAVLTVAFTGHPFYPGKVYVEGLGLPAPLQATYLAFMRRAPDLSGPLLVVGLFGALQLAWSGVSRRSFWVLLAVLATATLLFSSGRRTGLAAFVACAVPFVLLNIRRFDWKAGAGLAATVAFSAALIAASPTARQGIERVVTDASEFLATPADRRGYLWSSAGERLHYWNVAGRVIRESPWFGTGYSRFGERFQAHDAAMGGSHKPQTNPHNEYLLVFGATGVVGLLFYAGVWARATRHAWRLRSTTQRNVALLFLLAVLTSMLFNSLLIDMVPGHFFVTALLTLAYFDWHDRAPGTGAAPA